MNTPLEYAFLSDDQKAADMAAIMRVKCGFWGRLLISFVPASWRREAYIKAWDHVHAGREAARRLAR